MSQTLHLGRIAATIPVADIQRSLDFYGRLLGMACVFKNGDPPGFAILKKDEAELHLTLAPGHKGGDRNVAHLMVNDAEALYRACEASGVRILKGIRDKDYGLRAFVMADPDGNRIDVGQPL